MKIGINHFETARGYGNSEIQLGNALKKLPREKIIIQTKVGPTETETEFEEKINKKFKNSTLHILSLHLNYPSFLL